MDSLDSLARSTQWNNSSKTYIYTHIAFINFIFVFAIVSLFPRLNSHYSGFQIDYYIDGKETANPIQQRDRHRKGHNRALSVCSLCFRLFLDVVRCFCTSLEESEK